MTPTQEPARAGEQMSENTKAVEGRVVPSIPFTVKEVRVPSGWTIDGDALAAGVLRLVHEGDGAPMLRFKDDENVKAWPGGACWSGEPVCIRFSDTHLAQPAVPEGVENVPCPECGGSLRTWGCTCTPRWPLFVSQPAAQESAQGAAGIRHSCETDMLSDCPACVADLATPQPESAQGERGAVDACARVSAFVTEYRRRIAANPRGGMDPEDVYSLGMAGDPLVLRISDLAALTTPTGDQNARAVAWVVVDRNTPDPYRGVMGFYWSRFATNEQDAKRAAESFGRDSPESHFEVVPLYTTPPAPVAQAGDGVTS